MDENELTPAEVLEAIRRQADELKARTEEVLAERDAARAAVKALRQKERREPDQATEMEIPTEARLQVLERIADDHDRSVKNINKTLNVLGPVVNDLMERLDGVETALALLIPGVEKVNTQQRERIAELKAEIAAKDAEIAKLKGITIN